MIRKAKTFLPIFLFILLLSSPSLSVTLTNVYNSAGGDPIYDINASNSNVVYAVGGVGEGAGTTTILKSTQGGGSGTWTDVSPGGAFGVGRAIWVYGDNNIVYSRYDDIWKVASVLAGGPNKGVYDIAAGSGSFTANMAAVGIDPGPNNVYYSTNSGDNWTSSSPENAINLLGACFIPNTNKVVVVGGSNVPGGSRIFYSINGGNGSWSINKATGSKGLTGVHFYDANNGFAVGEDASIFKTVNGGDNWTASTGPSVSTFGTTYQLSKVHMFSPDHILVVGGQGNQNIGVILESWDGGSTWTSQTITGALSALWVSGATAWMGGQGSTKIYQANFAPTLTSVTYGGGSSIVAGITDATVVVTGTGFDSIGTFGWPTGVTEVSRTRLSATQWNCVISISLTAPTGQVNISYNQYGQAIVYSGLSIDSPPVMTSIGIEGSPDISVQGLISQDFLIRGSNFRPNATITMNWPGVNVLGSQYVDTGTYKLSVVIDKTTSTGIFSVVMSLPNGGNTLRTHSIILAPAGPTYTKIFTDGCVPDIDIYPDRMRISPVPLLRVKGTSSDVTIAKAIFKGTNVTYVVPFPASSIAAGEVNYQLSSLEKIPRGVTQGWIYLENNQHGNTWAPLFTQPLQIAADGMPNLSNFIVNPNPASNPPVTLQWDQDTDSTIDFNIYNIQGQLIRGFTVSGKATSPQKTTWDMKDHFGDIVPSGVYVAIAKTGNIFLKRTKIAVYR